MSVVIGVIFLSTFIICMQFKALNVKLVVAKSVLIENLGKV